jgi:hypothetical protein
MPGVTWSWKPDLVTLRERLYLHQTYEDDDSAEEIGQPKNHDVVAFRGEVIRGLVYYALQPDNIQAWSVINKYFDQDVITTMETLVCGRRRTEKLERRPQQVTSTGYNKTLNVAGHLLQHTSAYIPITWAEGIAIEKKVQSWTRAHLTSTMT